MSLIHGLYKIISKILANRLKTVLDKLINHSQFAFVGRRQILDGYLVANEVIHYALSTKKGLYYVQN